MNFYFVYLMSFILASDNTSSLYKESSINEKSCLYFYPYQAKKKQKIIHGARYFITFGVYEHQW